MFPYHFEKKKDMIREVDVVYLRAAAITSSPASTSILQCKYQKLSRDPIISHSFFGCFLASLEEGLSVRPSVHPLRLLENRISWLFLATMSR